MTAAKLQHIWSCSRVAHQYLMRPMTTPPLTAADVLTAREVANLLGVPQSTVHHWARRGLLPSRKIGRRRLFIRSKVEALLLSD
jgi:excisionase family DNA binding protein